MPEIKRSWCTKMAELEGEHEIGVGFELSGNAFSDVYVRSSAHRELNQGDEVDVRFSGFSHDRRAFDNWVPAVVVEIQGSDIFVREESGEREYWLSDKQLIRHRNGEVIYRGGNSSTSPVSP
ncbi:hypothetical protein ACFOY8_12495 [Thalassospira xianhensis]|nr:hypothetical protein [Thalassospira xianhensis]